MSDEQIPQPPNRANRRRARRGPTKSSVKVQCRKGAWGLGPNIAGRVLDISDTGIKMIVSQSLAPGSDVELIIEGYGLKTNIKRLGTIRWQVQSDADEYYTGIEFQKPLQHRDWHSIVVPSQT